MIKEIFILSILTILFLFITVRIVRKLYKSPMPAYLGNFINSKWRKLLQPPERVIQRSRIKNGMTILEIGCGTGTYTFHCAKTIGKEGNLYAIDISKQMVDKLTVNLNRSENKDIKNISIQKASVHRLPFDDNFFDLIFMVSVFPELPDIQKAISECYRVLKKNGILAVSEFLIDPDYPLRRNVVKLCTARKFIHTVSEGNFFSYTLVFEKNNDKNTYL